MKQTLLIADGDAESRGRCRRFLIECGYEVETASDGLDCLRKLRQVTPAVFVLDLELRWGGGDGVLAWVREERPAHRIPVILTAMAGCPQDFAEFIEPPVIGCLPRPFALAALLESVCSAIATKERSEPSYLRCIPAAPELFIG